jgi:predicted MFS family arabinose efflux permease
VGLALPRPAVINLIMLFLIGLAIGNLLVLRWIKQENLIKKMIPAATLVSALGMFLVVMHFPNQLLAVLLAAIGLIVPLSMTSMMILVSDSASNDMQGRALGVMVGSRVFGNVLISLIFSDLLVLNAAIPIVSAAIILVFSTILFFYFRKKLCYN